MRRTTRLSIAGLLAVVLVLAAAGPLMAQPFAATPSQAYRAARREWEHAPCVAAAIQARYWLGAAADLRSQGHRSRAAGRAIRELGTLAHLPETSETPAQMRRFTGAAKALNRFFHTPGNLIGIKRYCSVHV